MQSPDRTWLLQARLREGWAVYFTSIMEFSSGTREYMSTCPCPLFAASCHNNGWHVARGGRRGQGNEVIEFSNGRTDGDTSSIVVRYSSYEDFKGRGKVRVFPSTPAFSSDEIVARATSMVQTGPGRPKFGTYHAGDNNCEHFANWCRTGEKTSGQFAAWCASATGFSGKSKAR